MAANDNERQTMLLAQVPQEREDIHRWVRFASHSSAPGFGGNGQRSQLFSASPSTCPTLWTDAKIRSTSPSNCWSSGSFTHWAHFRMFSGLAEPAMVVAISGLATENCSASWAMSTPLLAQCAAAW